MPKSRNNELTGKQKAFCYEYTIDHNAKEAAERAGYSPKGSKVRGCNLLTNNNVKVEIARIKAKIRAKSDYNRQQGEKDYEQVRLLALDKGDLQAANTSIRGKNKLYALETDKIETKDLTPVKALTEAEQRAYDEAGRVLKIRLASA